VTGIGSLGLTLICDNAVVRAPWHRRPAEP
jgi:hypothetical protein